MAPNREPTKPSAQGERFVALARKVEIVKPDEVFDRKFDELTIAKPAARAVRKLKPRVASGKPQP